MGLDSCDSCESWFHFVSEHVSVLTFVVLHSCMDSIFTAEREAVNAAERAERKQQLREKVKLLFVLRIRVCFIN